MPKSKKGIKQALIIYHDFFKKAIKNAPKKQKNKKYL